jgi:hypothetical protein
MKSYKLIVVITALLLISLVFVACSSETPALSEEEQAEIKELTEEAKTCIECHSTETPGIVAIWDQSAHAEVAISCLDCHAVDPDSPLVLSGVEGHEDLKVSVSMLVPPSVCAECHENEVEQFHAGNEIIVDDTGHPTADTYPSSGIGNLYPDGDVGNCSVCHTRHSFSIADARRPEACASCHLGPDHPDIEIYEASKAPTCATCHISGIGDLEVTHNISERLYWNLWAKVSKPRTDPDVMGMYYGDGETGRELMTQVCTECHSTTLAESFFASGDKAVNLYNDVYFAKAEEMRAELAELGLLKENPWKDEFQIVYYHLWHHEGRRARQGAMMAGPDWAHWHGFFELMQDIYKLEDIYQLRIETGVIE